MASVPALVSRNDAVNERVGCVSSAFAAAQPRHIPPPFSKNAPSKATFAPFAESSTEAMSMRSSKLHGSPSASSTTERHVQTAHPAWEPFALFERLISTTIEPSVLRRRHPEVEIAACANEKRLHAMALDGFGAELRAAGKKSAMTGVAQAATGVPVASAPQSATTGKRFFDAMGSP